jgi:hypothetical protein
MSLDILQDLKQRLPGSPKGGSNSSTPPLEDSPSTSTFLQHIEGEKNRVRVEMEKKVLEEDNAKLRQKNTDLQDQFEYWKNRYHFAFSLLFSFTMVYVWCLLRCVAARVLRMCCAA